MLFAARGDPFGESDLNSWLYSTSPENITSFSQIFAGFSTDAFSDIQFKNNDPTNNVILALTTGSALGTSVLFRGTRLDNIVGTSLDTDPFFSYYPNMSKLMNIPGTSTWYIAGGIGLSEGGNEPSQQTVFVKSENDGLTWDFANAKVFGPAYPAGAELRMVSRDLNTGQTSIYDKKFDPYLRGGVAMGYSGNVWIAGGAKTFLAADTPVMVYSTDFGDNWTTVTNGFTEECATINVDNSGLLVATGSSGYKTYDFAIGGGAYVGDTTTIKYSTDSGQSWNDASGGFGLFGYELIYANGTWVATGTSAVPDTDGYAFVPELRYSTNGVNWSLVDFPSTVFTQDSNAVTSVVSNAIRSEEHTSELQSQPF
jgi:hypothetical protein